MLPATLESLFIRLQLHFNGSMPAIIILNMHRALQGEQDRPDIEMCIKAAQTEEDWCATNKTCHDTFLDLPKARTMIAPSELISHNVARYYGFTSLSHTGLINSMFRDDVHGRLKLSECQMFVKLFKDRVHPNNQGRLLMVRLLLGHLAACWGYYLFTPARLRSQCWRLPLCILGRISTLVDLIFFSTAVSDYCLCLLALTTCCLTQWVPAVKAAGNTGTSGV